jgi:hypothetical protein
VKDSLRLYYYKRLSAGVDAKILRQTTGVIDMTTTFENLITQVRHKKEGEISDMIERERNSARNSPRYKELNAEYESLRKDEREIEKKMRHVSIMKSNLIESRHFSNKQDSLVRKLNDDIFEINVKLVSKDNEAVAKMIEKMSRKSYG